MLLVGWHEGHPAGKKTEWWGAGMVICLERGADLHITQQMPLPLTVSCFSKIQISFSCLVPAHSLKHWCSWPLAWLPTRKLVFCIHTLPQTERNVYIEVVCRKIQMVDTTSSKVKGKVFPYSLPSVGPGADPGVQAVSLQVTWSESRHIPSISLPLLSARPAVTPVAFTRWRYAGRGKFAGQRPTFYHCATPPTLG